MSSTPSLTDTMFRLNSEINARFFGDLTTQELEAGDSKGQIWVASLFEETCIYRVKLLFELGLPDLKDVAHITFDEYGLGWSVPDGKALDAMRSWVNALETYIQGSLRSKVETVKQKVVFKDATNRGMIMNILSSSGCSPSRLLELEETLWSVWGN